MYRQLIVCKFYMIESLNYQFLATGGVSHVGEANDFTQCD